MPVSIDIHENEFLEEIYQKGQESGAAIVRRILIVLLEQRFGSLPASAHQQILAADLDTLDRFASHLVPAASLEEVLV